MATCALWTHDVPIRMSCVANAEVTMKPLWGQVRGHVLRLYAYYAHPALLRFQHSDTHTHTHKYVYIYIYNIYIYIYIYTYIIYI